MEQEVNIEKKGENDRYSYLKCIGTAIFSAYPIKRYLFVALFFQSGIKVRRKKENRSWEQEVNIEKKGENDRYSYLKCIGAAIFQHIRLRGIFL